MSQINRKTAERKTYSIGEACDLLGIGRSSGYEAAGRGDFPVPVIKIGRRMLVPRQALDRLLGGEAA